MNDLSAVFDLSSHSDGDSQQEYTEHTYHSYQTIPQDTRRRFAGLSVQQQL